MDEPTRRQLQGIKRGLEAYGLADSPYYQRICERLKEPLDEPPPAPFDDPLA